MGYYSAERTGGADVGKVGERWSRARPSSVILSSGDAARWSVTRPLKQPRSPLRLTAMEKDARKVWRDARLALLLGEACECVVIVGRVHSGASFASSHKASIRKGFE